MTEDFMYLSNANLKRVKWSDIKHHLNQKFNKIIKENKIIFFEEQSPIEGFESKLKSIIFYWNGS